MDLRIVQNKAKMSLAVSCMLQDPKTLQSEELYGSKTLQSGELYGSKTLQFGDGICMKNGQYPKI